MLVLSRKLNETIIIDGNIRVTVVGIRGGHVRLGIEAPSSVPILREELNAFDRHDETASSADSRHERPSQTDKPKGPLPMPSALHS